MVGKILFTSSSNKKQKPGSIGSQKKFVFFLLVAIGMGFASCTPKLGWIRTLPSSFPRDQDLPLGFYDRPTEKKSAMGSKSFHLFWKETIQIVSDTEFKKTWREWKVYEDHLQFRQIIGKGQFEKSKDWVLLSTKEVNTKECRVEKIPNLKAKRLIQKIPCEMFSLDVTKKYQHNLVYYYDGKSLYPLQYESGYEEANFGIAWESDEPYTKTKLFEIAKLKYGKKEFQPHVYHHVKLD
ncbi:hypothetical protein LEP1GSC202_2144 [Leptospira yanagawae serovar Saopaulo str. Sao Paulo = ATCC 700523]|uniref:Uncharacterized protein n=1 Tax=Leptospira yanagawae serovar Saopaulo str. Sao Paulo = ATCC 700523 TaxID=1249483 RepID=A0A5E8H8W0_9LEPT|nr:hypothetical protein [Leptospira yanagawae]EOQ87775.1 hypothetical protein LEP1GSC202_2144 [Leptospira yanagawae serovar Saopaulo str. Sao Paulo = ATCC 700523]